MPLILKTIKFDFCYYLLRIELCTGRRCFYKYLWYNKIMIKKGKEYKAIFVSPELHKEIKKAAVEKGMTMIKLLEELLKKVGNKK